MISSAKTFLQKLFKPNDIRWWIILFFILRLYNIWTPPIEISHNWRQVTGNMIARNFHENDANILYPRLDNGGQQTGITGTEFPLLSYLHYLMALVFGYAHWYGRFINLIISSFGIYYFYQLVLFILPKQTARNASILLIASSWLIFSRKAMPDTFSMSIVMAGLYYAILFLREGNKVALSFSIILLPLGTLCKIPAAYLFGILIPLLLSTSISTKRKLYLSIGLLPGMLYVVYWYFYWVPWLTHHFGFEHYFMGSSLKEGTQEIISNLSEVAKKFYTDAMSYIGFFVCVAGIFIGLKNKEKSLFIFSVPITLLFVLFMLKSGYRFYHHSYYIVPFVPVMCLFAAYAIQHITIRKYQIALLSVIVIENIANLQHDFVYKQSEAYKLNLETIADNVSSKGDLIAINGGQNPQELYFTHRKGWTFKQEQINIETIDSITKLGCKYLFINKHEFEQTLPYSIKKATEDYIIYSLKRD